MLNNQMTIILTLDDKLSQGLKQASSTLDKFSSDAKALGRDIRQVGSALALTGGAISGPFILAIKQATEHSDKIRKVVNQLTATVDAFYVKIATAVLPVIERLSRSLTELLAWVNSLPPAMVNTVAQGALMAGIFLTLSGIVIALSGQLILFASNIAGSSIRSRQIKCTVK